MDGFSSHSGLDAFLEATVLALVPVVLVDRAVPVSSTSVREVPSNGSLEEALASLTSELTIVLSGTLVSADDTLDVQLLSILLLLLQLL